MSTTLERDVNEVPMPVLPWGRTQTLTTTAGNPAKTSGRITQGVRVVTLVTRDAQDSEIRFEVVAQDYDDARNADPAPVIPSGGVVDVPIPRDLVVDADTGAGVSVISDDAVTVHVIERA